LGVHGPVETGGGGKKKRKKGKEKGERDVKKQGDGG